MQVLRCHEQLIESRGKFGDDEQELFFHEIQKQELQSK